MMSLFKRFRRDRRGVAAVEFAMILPIMVMLYLGSIELTELMLANRRVENLAASAADIIARDTLVTNDELDDLQTALELLMRPNAQEGLQVRVTSITINNGQTATVTWSHSYFDYAALATGAAVVDLPQDLMSPDTPSIVRAEVIYDYASPMQWLLPASFRMTHTEYRRPRLVDPVPLCVNNCG